MNITASLNFYCTKIFTPDEPLCSFDWANFSVWNRREKSVKVISGWRLKLCCRRGRCVCEVIVWCMSQRKRIRLNLNRAYKVFAEATSHRVCISWLSDTLKPCSADTGNVTWPLKCQACALLPWCRERIKQNEEGLRGKTAKREFGYVKAWCGPVRWTEKQYLLLH